MKYLYLYITPKTRSRGLNDLFVNIYRSYKYCRTVNRILLIDFTTTVYKCNLSEIFIFRQEDIICNSNKIKTIIESCNDKIYPNKKVREIVGLNKKTDFKNKLVNIHLSGWGCHKTEAIHKDNLKQNPQIVWKFIFSSIIIINKAVRKRFKKLVKKLPNKYTSLQIRNTDRKSNYLNFIKKNKRSLCDTIYVATDDKTTLNILTKTLTNYKVLNYTNFPNNYGTLHNSEIDGITKLTDIFTDLYIISKSYNFFSNSPGSFSELCSFIYKNKHIL